jgi:histidyl-tRNA synthetase
LGVGRQRVQQVASAFGVEFPENVVEQVDGRRPAAGADEGGLREAESEGDGALLALAGEGGSGGAVEFEGEVVAVRTDHRLPQAPLLGGAGGEGGCEVVAAGAFVAQAGHFAARADGGHLRGDEGGERGAKFPAGAAEVCAGGEERSVVGGEFASAVRTLLEQEIARAQRAFVGAEVFEVAGIALAAEEVEEAAAFRRGAAHQFDVLVGKERDEAGAEVFVGFALRQAVEGEFAAFGFGQMAGQGAVAGVAGQRKAVRPVPHGLGKGARARGLQAQEEADGLEHRGFAAGVGRAQQVQAGSRGEIRPREAAEVVHCEGPDNHGLPVSIFPAEKPDVAKEELKAARRRPNMGGPMQSLPGFRDFFPSDCARRNYITGTWCRVARAYGFREYDGPTLEPLDLYRKKNSGGEILGQLFSFTDKGEREVALRPEMTPTVARMLIAKAREFRKPIKWFSIAPFFRYEKQQSGRLREFLQLNCDLVGDDSPAADAEMLALLIATMRGFGLTGQDIVVRVSDRRAWMEFLAARGVTDEAQAREALSVIDKLEREAPDVLQQKLAAFGLELADVQQFIDGARPEFFTALSENLAARGMEGFCELDLRIVRGLAYYTGLVFEVFDRRSDRRALAGGGRFDRLLSDLSGGKVDLPAIGFGIGDVVLGDLLEDLPSTRALLESAVARDQACEVFVVVADEGRRAEALGVVQLLRALGRRVDYALTADKVARQFKDAAASGATVALVVGDEWPKLKVKNLAERTETELAQEALADWAANLQTPAP